MTAAISSPTPDWRSVDGYAAAAKKIIDRPDSFESWVEFGRTRWFRNETDAAIDAYRQAVKLAPGNSAAQMMLADALSSAAPYNRTLGTVMDPVAMGREAMDIYADFLRVPDTRSTALIGMGRTANRLGDFAKGFAYLDEAVGEYPQQANNAWNAIEGLPRSFPSMESFVERLLKLDSSFAFKMRVSLSSSQVELKRGDFEQSIMRLESALDELSYNEETPLFLPGEYSALYSHPFIVYYPQYNDLPLRERLTAFFNKTFPDLNYTSSRVSRRLSTPTQKKIRLGFVVLRCMDVDFASLFVNMLKHIDKSRFEIVFLYNDRTLQENEYSRQLWELVDQRAVFPLSNWDAYCRIVEKNDIDILFHETWGGTPTFTGFARLAAVQCQFLDRIISLGSSRQDYALYWGNAKRFDRVSSMFTEKSVLLPGDIFASAPDRTPANKIDPSCFGVPAGVKLFFTWQSLVRWRSDDDQIIGTLLRRYPDAWFLARHDLGQGTKVVEHRWRTITLPDVADRIRFFHYLPLGQLIWMMQSADLVVPSPLEYGTISMFTAMGAGVPLAASWYGKETLSVIALLYEKWGIEGLTARDQSEFADILCRLVDDPEWKAMKAAEILEKSEQLFYVGDYMNELQDFCEKALQRARTGLPPKHWCGGEFRD